MFIKRVIDYVAGFIFRCSARYAKNVRRPTPKISHTSEAVFSVFSYKTRASSNFVASVRGRLPFHKPYHLVYFPKTACQACQARALCTRAKQQPRRLYLHPRLEHEALHAARQRLKSEEGKRLYAQRAGVEGSLSQGVRAFGIRRTRYRRLAKTHLQQVVTAVAINLDRIAAWLEGRPLAATRTSHFAALAA